MTHTDDPCDELSEGLTGLLLFGLSLSRMPPAQRRIAANTSSRAQASAEYARLVEPTIARILGP